MSKRKVAIIGSGNIGTDLMIKILRHGQHLEMAVMVGIDPQSDGLARARRMGVATTHEGVIGLMNMPEFADIDIVFDATSAGAHVKNDAALREAKPDIRLIDLTPAAIGPYCVPVVNLEANVDQLNVNMVTCGGQATIPMAARPPFQWWRQFHAWRVFITPKLSLLSPVNLPDLARVPISMNLRKPLPEPLKWWAARQKGRRLLCLTQQSHR